MNDDLDWSFGQIPFVTNHRARERVEATSVEHSFGFFFSASSLRPPVLSAGNK